MDEAHIDHITVADPLALPYVAALGSAMVATTTPTPLIEETLDTVATLEHLPIQTSITPSGVLVVESASGRTSLVRPGHNDLRFDQTEQLYTLMRESTAGTVTPADGLARLASIKAMRPVVTAPFRVVGFWCCAVGLCLRQNPGQNELIAVALIGIVLAIMLVLMPKAGRLESLVVLGAAMLTGWTVTLLVQQGEIRYPNQLVVPLLASFIPGGALTVGALEVSVGAVQAGALRLVGAVYRLVLLALGLFPAIAALQAPFPLAHESRPISALYWQPIGIVLFGIGIWLAFSAPRGALSGLVVALLISWAVQSATHLEAHVYLSSFLGAIAAVLVAHLLYLKLHMAPEILTVTPLFRVLAPGGLTLIGMTSLVADGTTDLELSRLVLTLISVTVGLGIGLLAADSFDQALARRASRAH